MAILRAEFWRVCSFWILEGEVLGYQMGAAYVINDRMSDLYVMRMVSFCWPQVVPARALIMLRRGVMRDMRDEM